MSGELPFMDLNGVEIANAYRTLAYLQRGLGSLHWEVPEVYPCEVLGREVGGARPFLSPALDPAPWYDAATPESGEFLGMIVNLDFQTIDVKRSISQRFGGVGGGVIGVEQQAARAVKVQAMLIASTCAGLEYGRHWIYTKLGADCAGCALGTLRVRESCPPSDGSNDTRGERILYDVALVEGIARTDDGGALCCDYDGLEFTLAGQSPYLFARPGATSTAVAVGNGSDYFPTTPAVLDTFVRANAGPPPSASWTSKVSPGHNANLVVVSNLLQTNTHSAGTTGSAYWNAATFGPDQIATLLVPTILSGGNPIIYGRIVNPGASTVDYVALQMVFGSAGTGGANLYRIVDDGSGSQSLEAFYSTAANVPVANGDTFALVCRGNLIQGWRKPSGGNWGLIVSGYDPAYAAVNGYVGLGFNEQGATQTVSTFSAGTLTNGSYYPKTVLSVPIPAQSIGIMAPIVTLTNNPQLNYGITSGGVRVQLKPQDSGGECAQSDDFAVNDYSTRWLEVSLGGPYYAISGGKLKPTAAAVGVGQVRMLSRKNAAGAAISWPGGMVRADVTLGTTIANGSWGVQLGGTGNLAGAWLIKTAGAGSNLFALTWNPGGVLLDSVAFTPVAGTTYRLIAETNPTGVANVYSVTAYLIDPATGQMLTRPLHALTNGANPMGPTFTPQIGSVAVDLAEAWDNFYAIDYSDSTDYMEADFSGGTMVINTPRRTVAFTPAGSTVSVDGTGMISTPIDTPLGWPDVCAGDGAQCLQIWADQPQSGLSALNLRASVALQHKVR